MHIIWKIKSAYALVSCIRDGDKIYVEKQLSPEIVNATNTKWVNETSKVFREKLKHLNVPLVEPYEFLTQNGSVIQRAPYAGDDLEESMRRGKFAQKDLDNLILGISGVLTQETPDTGIDARLSNFCLWKGEIVYVDTFPPLVKFNNELIVHFPNPTNPEVLKMEFERKFKSLGILRRLRFSILEQGNNWGEKELLLSVKNIMGLNFYLEVKDFFSSFLDNMGEHDAINKISLDDLDGIREVAIKVLQKNPDRKELLKEIFNLSSNFCPYNLSEDERLKKVRQILSHQYAIS